MNFTQLGRCNDIVEIWFGITNGQIFYLWIFCYCFLVVVFFFLFFFSFVFFFFSKNTVFDITCR